MNGMVAYTDYVVAPKAIELSQKGTVTCQKLSDETGIPYGTVKVALSRLVKNSILQRAGKGRKWGYVYRPGKNFSDIGD